MKKLSTLGIILLGIGTLLSVQAVEFNELAIKVFYLDMIRALEKANADALCQNLSEQYVGEATVVRGRNSSLVHVDKSAACANIKARFSELEQLKKQYGDRLKIHHKIQVKKINLGETWGNAKAEVEFKHSASADGKLIIFENGHSIETLKYQKKRIVILDSHGTVNIYAR
jgi:hypothetical protein